MNDFSRNLQRIMSERRLTLKEVSAACDIPVSTLGEWRNGRVPRLSPELLRLSRYLGLPLEKLLEKKANQA